MPPTKENTFLKRYLEAANISEIAKTSASTSQSPAANTNDSDNSNKDNLNLTDSDIDEIMAAEILPLFQKVLLYRLKNFQDQSADLTVM